MTDSSAATEGPVILYVTYQGTSEARFDRNYYVAHHLPLVMKAFEQYGLKSVAAFFPAVEQAGTIAICECRFASEVAIAKSFGSEEAVAVMADVARFTDLPPMRTRAMPLT